MWVESLTLTLSYKNALYTLRCNSQKSISKWRHALQLQINTCRIAALGTIKLTNTSLLSTLRGWLWRITVTVRGCERLFGKQKRVVNAYCIVRTTSQQVYRTAVASASNPVWEQTFVLYLDTVKDVLQVHVLDYSKYSQDVSLGRCEIDFQFLEYADHRHEEQVRLRLEGAPYKDAMLRLQLHYSKKGCI
jgi:hypothetical protein